MLFSNENDLEIFGFYFNFNIDFSVDGALSGQVLLMIYSYRTRRADSEYIYT